MKDNINLKQQILDSIKDLERRFSVLSNDDIAADIINVICKYIITNKILDYRTSEHPMLSFQYNWTICSSFVRQVILSLKDDLSGIVSSKTSESLTQNVCLNLGWSEMPVFLDNYFIEKHGTSLSEEREFFDFISIRHERYINECIVSKSQVDRNIRISCWNNRENITIEINPTLSLKKAYLKKKYNHLYIYNGEDPDYFFEVRFDDNDDIDYVSVSLQSRNLKLSFY